MSTSPAPSSPLPPGGQPRPAAPPRFVRPGVASSAHPSGAPPQRPVQSPRPQASAVPPAAAQHPTQQQQQAALQAQYAAQQAQYYAAQQAAQYAAQQAQYAAQQAAQYGQQFYPQQQSPYPQQPGYPQEAESAYPQQAGAGYSQQPVYPQQAAYPQQAGYPQQAQPGYYGYASPQQPVRPLSPAQKILLAQKKRRRIILIIMSVVLALTLIGSTIFVISRRKVTFESSDVVALNWVTAQAKNKDGKFEVRRLVSPGSETLFVVADRSTGGEMATYYRVELSKFYLAGWSVHEGNSSVITSVNNEKNLEEWAKLQGYSIQPLK